MTFRLHSRLVLWNLLIIGLISAILGYFLNFSLREDIQKQVQNQLLDQSVLAAAYLAKADPGKSLDDQADELGRLLNVRVTIIAHDGRVLGDSDVEASQLVTLENHRLRPEVQEAVQAGTGSAIRWSDTVKVEFIYVARRLDPYILRLAMPLSAVDAFIRDLRSQLAFAMLIALGLTLVFGYVVFGLISRPLRGIAAASKKLAAGNLDQRLPITGDEEIAALGTSLNTMAQNLSARMRELSEGKQRLELILEAMGQGVMVLDKTGRISLTNTSIGAVLGTGRDISGKTPLEIFRRPELENAVHAVLDGAPTQVLEISIGNGRILQANVAPVPNASGEIDSVVVVFHDLTDIRRTEKMRRDFVANVSHEFKTPLTSIRGYAETLLSGAKDDPKIAIDFLRTIERNAEHLEALVTDLLVLARLEAEVPANKDSFDLKSVIEEQLASRKNSIEEASLQVKLDCGIIEIHADRPRVATALSNLIDNAIHYNKPGGEIRISAEIHNGELTLAVADTGHGIPSEELPRIFERFYRVDKARARESGGTGLGLSIVKHAIESQGGTINVTSRIGTGSTFTIRLPL
jgi:two-component system phosphate regulon sensor histidine kinase PhoR